MRSDIQTENPRKSRTANACVACRQSKIKCSGDEPCANCKRRAVKCSFVEGGTKVLVDERYLKELQRQARERQRPPPPKRSADSAFGSGVEVLDGDSDSRGSELPPPQGIDHARSIWTSPFTLPSKIIKNTHKNKRNWIWLAPSSMWSFTARLTVMMTEKLLLKSPYSAPNFLAREIYPLEWKPSAVEEPPDISGLPSVDHSLYLFNTVKFHLGQNYRLFDEETFVNNVHDFYYGNAAQKAAEYRLWFVQFLLVLSFGTAFLSGSRNNQDPPGSKFFLRAMSLMPDHASLWKDSFLAIEVLALAGLYLYSIDHRESAHVYVGQAIRIAQLEGLHTQLPEEVIGEGLVTRCRNLWWTLYIMDRHFSSSLGLPMTTQDSDITALIDPPSTCSQRDATVSLEVRLSHLLSVILTTLYKTERTQLGTFLEKTRSILHTLAGHAQEIENIIHLKFQNSVNTMPKGTRRITLLYHQCVIVATRPLLLSVLKERLEKLGHGEEDWQSFLTPIKTLISTGIKSASKSLQILSDEDSFLEVFLPFDLEFTYGAAIYLTMANALFPRVQESQISGGDAHRIIDEMIEKGNRLAEVRKAELDHLETLFQELVAQIERRGLETLTLSVSPQQPDIEPSDDPIEETPGRVFTTDHGSIVPLTPLSPSEIPQTSANPELLDNIGISSCEFFSIVDQIGNSDYYGVFGSDNAWKESI